MVGKKIFPYGITIAVIVKDSFYYDRERKYESLEVFLNYRQTLLFLCHVRFIVIQLETEMTYYKIESEKLKYFL